MPETISFLYLLIGVIVSLIAGFSIANLLSKKATIAKEQLAGDKAQIIIKEAEAEAEVLKKNKILEAKEKFLHLKTEHEKVISEKFLFGNHRERNIQKTANAALNMLKKELE